MSMFRKKLLKRAPEDLLLFLHIPKTAGTSLRFELEKCYQKSEIVADYGPDSPSTDGLVMKYIYSEQGPKCAADLVSVLRSSGKIVLTGHFRLSKYSDYFPSNKIFSIIRDPLHRAASEFLHNQRQNTFSGSFFEFFNRPLMINRLTMLLDNYPEEMIIGTTERYKESLFLINKQFGLHLKPKRKNVAPKGGAGKFVKSLDSSVINRFRDLNEADYALYKSIDAKISSHLAS